MQYLYLEAIYKEAEEIGGQLLEEAEEENIKRQTKFPTTISRGNEN